MDTDNSAERFRGALKWFNLDKGYGFIVPDSPTGHAADVFVHVSEVEAAGINARDLYDGIRIEYSLQIPKRGPKKPAAARLKIIDSQRR